MSLEFRVKNLRSKGLTLLEVIIAMGIAGLTGGLLILIIVNSAGIFYKQSSKLSEGLNINDALSQIRKTIKQSGAVQASFTNGLQPFTSSPTQLVLKVPAIDSSNNIIINTFDYFIFYSDQNSLRFKIFPDNLSSRKVQDQIFSTLLGSLLFQYFSLANPEAEVAAANAQKVRITLTLKQKSGAGFEINTATSEANLRND